MGYRLEGDLLEVCDCKVLCPCWIGEDPDNVERGARIMLAAHYLERIGDRVTNIAEDVVFLASGEVEDLNP